MLFRSFILKRLPGPIGRPLGTDVEVGGLVKHSVVVIAAQRRFALVDDPVQAFPRACPVPDDVSQAKHLFDSAALDVRKHNIQGFDIGMNVRNNSEHVSESDQVE